MSENENSTQNEIDIESGKLLGKTAVTVSTKKRIVGVEYYETKSGDAIIYKYKDVTGRGEDQETAIKNFKKAYKAGS
jgi:low affinity Fe/Cu permease